MRFVKGNIAGLASPLQHAEMKSILGGTWPPLMPLPVFKYETDEYRATIDFDKKRGEWVCRKTSLPSNKLQELRGGLREITMALPHGEAEMFTEDAEQQEQELEKDANRRLQAIHDWRENYENGARYFELRDYLSESQRTEIDDSLRLSLTARQLQFNSKNVAYVFDALSTAGGRFAALIEFAKRNKARQGTGPQAQGEGAREAEPAIDHDKQSLGINSRELGPVLNNNKPQSVAPAPTSSRPCRLRMFSRSKTRPPWQNEWHTLRLNNWRSRPVRLWMRILNRSSNILTKKGTTPSHLPVLRRKFERASRPRIASRARPRAFLLLKYPHFRSLYLHYCFCSR